MIDDATTTPSSSREVLPEHNRILAMPLQIVKYATVIISVNTGSSSLGHAPGFAPEG